MLELFTSIIPVLVIGILLDLMVARSSDKRILGYATSFLITLFFVPLVLLITGSDTNVYEILIGLGIALMWWFIYLNFVQAVESSIRVRMLMEIQAKGGSLTIDELRQAYNDEKLIRIRLERLENAGAVTNINSQRYLKSTKLRKAALFFTALKRLVLNKASQFD